VEQCSCVDEHWSLFRPTQPAIDHLKEIDDDDALAAETDETTKSTRGSKLV